MKTNYNMLRALVFWALLLSSFVSLRAQSSLRLVVPIGHTQPISALAVSPDDKLILSGGMDNTIHLWSADAGRLLKTYRGHSNSIASIQFSHSGKYFASVESYGRGFVRDLNTGAVLDSVKLTGMQLSSAKKADAFCWVGDENELHLWTPKQSKIILPQKKFFKATISHDGKYILAIGETTTETYWGYDYEFMYPLDVYLFNVTSGVTITLRKAQLSESTQLGFSPDGAIAIVGDHGNSVFAYSVTSGKLLSSASKKIWLDYFEINSEGLVKLNCYDGLYVWNPLKNTLQEFQAADNKRFGNVVPGIQKLGAVLTSVELDSIRNNNYSLAESAKVLPWQNDLFFISNSLMNSYDLESSSLRNKSRVAVWRDEKSKEPLLIPAFVAAGFAGKNWLASSTGSIILIHNLENGQLEKELKGLSLAAPEDVSFSPDNQFLAFRDKSIRIWGFNQSKLHTIESDSGAVFSMINNPQSQNLILIGGNRKIEFRNTESGSLLYTLKSDEQNPFGHVRSLLVNPDLNFLIWRDESNQTFIRKLNWNHLDWYSYKANTDSLWLSYHAVLKGNKEYSSFNSLETPPMAYFFFPGKSDIYTAVDMKSNDSFGRNDVLIHRQTLSDKISGRPIYRGNGYYSSDPKGFSFNEVIKVDASLNGERALVLSTNRSWNRLYNQLHIFDFVKEKEYNNWYSSRERHVGFWPLTAAMHPFQPWFAVTGENSNEIRTFPVEGKEEFKPFSGHNDHVTSLAFSHDGKLLASSSADNTIRIWNAETRQELATILAFNSQDWAVIHPSGLFDATPGAMSYLYFSSGSETIGLEQLKDRFYEPNLLKKIMSGEVLRSVSGLDRIDLYPSIATTLDTLNARLTVHLTDRGGGIGKTSISINGKEALEDIRSLASGTNAKGTLTAVVDLSKFKTLNWGKLNYIGVKSFNGGGYIASPSQRIYYEAPQKSQYLQTYEPALYSLVVGVSDYANDELDLKYSSKDAQDFATALSAAGSRLFGNRSQVTLLSSDLAAPALKPTKENIISRLKEIAEKAKTDDLVVLYFSGHGTNLSGEEADFLYLTSDARGFTFTDPAMRQNSTLSSTELTEIMKNIAAQKFVMIFDACASGRMVENMLAKRDVPASTLRAMERMKDRTGTYILSGCAADAVSYEASQFGQGLLTYSLLSGMKGAALRENRFVDVLKLFQYAKDEVPRLAENVGGIQEPKVFSPYGGESFDIGLLEDADKKLIPLTEAKPFFVRSSFQNELKMRDDLGLSKAVDQVLADQSNQGKNSLLIFIDAVEFPGAYNVYGRYKTEGNATKLSLVVYKNEVQISSFEKTLTTTAPNEIAEVIQQFLLSVVKQKNQ